MMRTASLLMYPGGSLHPGGSASGRSASGGSASRGSASGGVCIQGGLYSGVCIQGFCIWGGLHPRGSVFGGLHLGVLHRGGVLFTRGEGVCPTPQVCQWEGLGRPPSPLVNRMTHRCKTLPCPKLRLRAVII